MNRNAIVALLGLLILGAIIGTYSNHFDNEFHFDDAHTIVDNGYIRTLSNIPLFFKDCTTSSAMPSHQGYRPLVTSTLAIDYALSMKKTAGQSGYDFFWYHMSNFTWFIIIVGLLYIIQLKLYNYAFNNENNKYFALLGCAWYGLHTANAETVNYIISRSDILSTLAIVGSFALYVGLPQLRKYYLYLLPAALGMFAKETTIMFAPALIAYIYMIERQKSLSEIFTKDGVKQFFGSIWIGIPALVICLALAVFSIVMTKHHEPGGTSMWWYLATQPYVVLHYVTQFFFPVSLTADTDLPMVIKLSDERLYFGVAFVIGLVVLIFKTSNNAKWRPFSYGLVWFLLMLLPTSSFIPLAEVTNDHRVFLPYIGLVFSMVCLVANLYYYAFEKIEVARYAMIGVLLLALSGYAYGTHERNVIWKTDEALWKDVTEKSPNNGRGWMNYGLTLMGRGDYNGALYAYEQALTKTPNYYILHINLGVLKDATGDKATAEQYYKNGLAYGPTYVEPYYYYARFLFNNARTTEAEVMVNQGLALFAGHLYSRYLQMDIYNALGDRTKLLDAAQTTLSIYPGDAKAQAYLAYAQNPNNVTANTQTVTVNSLISQSLAYYNAGKYNECIDACRKVLAIDDKNTTAYNNICTSYNQLLKYDSAVVYCERAIAIDANFTLAKNNLTWAKSQLKK